MVKHESCRRTYNFTVRGHIIDNVSYSNNSSLNFRIIVHISIGADDNGNKKNFLSYECKMFGMVLFVDETVIKSSIKLNSFH